MSSSFILSMKSSIGRQLSLFRKTNIYEETAWVPEDIAPMQTQLQCHLQTIASISLSWQANNYLIILFNRPKSSSINENNASCLCVDQKPHFLFYPFQIKAMLLTGTSIPPSPSEMYFIWLLRINTSAFLFSVSEWVNIFWLMTSLVNVMPLSFLLCFLLHNEHTQ